MGRSEQFLVFDSEDDGGVRMSDATTRWEALIDQMAADDRFDNRSERCLLFLEMVDRSPQILGMKERAGC